MIYEEVSSTTQRTFSATTRVLGALKLDGPLLIGLALIALFGQVVLYSASGQDVASVVRGVLRLVLGSGAMIFLAQMKPATLRRIAPWLFWSGVVLLFIVEAIGFIGKGAQRWLDLGILRFQPSEIMKLAVPMYCAAFLNDRQLPPDWGTLIQVAVLVLLPTALVVAQPDLGTGLLILVGGALVVLLAGLSGTIIAVMAALAVGGAWVGWNFLHDYQQKRVLMFLDPQQDPLGAGYHSIQAAIAIGSGGLFGKGWLHGSQGQLEFLPERSTDFIFAVIGEEFGLVGAALLLLLYLFVVLRSLYLAMQTQGTFARLLSGSLALTFFVYVFINAGMVTGLVPVVGVPLPLVSYGGTSMVTLLAGFGILMSLYSHRKLVG